MIHARGPTDPELQQLHTSNRAIIRQTSVIKERDETPSASLLQNRCIEDITLCALCTSNELIAPQMALSGNRREEMAW